jgi:hypothetical protein
MLDTETIHSTHKYRRVARIKQYYLQALLNMGVRPDGAPEWARGVKVIPAGESNWAVCWTRNRGH